jgi:hypothetical protein
LPTNLFKVFFVTLPLKKKTLKRKILTFLITQAAWMILGYLVFKSDKKEEEKAEKPKTPRKKAKRKPKKEVTKKANVTNAP